MEPFNAYLRDGKVVFEVDQRRFLADATRNARIDLSVIDAKQFFEFVLKHAFTLTHDIDEMGAHPTWWQRFSEALGKAAAAGGQGVRQIVVPEPTCGCDPEEYDGG